MSIDNEQVNLMINFFLKVFYKFQKLNSSFVKLWKLYATG